MLSLCYSGYGILFCPKEKKLKIALYKIWIILLRGEQDVFDVIWFPHMFISQDGLIPALAAIKRALKPTGILLTCALADQQGISINIKKLIHALYGGLRTAKELTNTLRSLGFTEISLISKMADYEIITALRGS